MNACSSELGQFREVGHHGSGPSGIGGGSNNSRISSQPGVRTMASQTRFFFEGVAHAQGEVAQEKQYSVDWLVDCSKSAGVSACFVDLVCS